MPRLAREDPLGRARLAARGVGRVESGRRLIIAEDNAHETAALKMVQVEMPREEEQKRSLPPKDGPPTASTKSLLAAGFAVKKAE